MADTTSELFIFKESEFEDENFAPASFVAKYRRVSSMESLREQLRAYCDSLKKQLYDVINRDYKDFITIATKLDGVDIRVEHLCKPLVDLRLDLASLHDGLISSMHAIDDKLNERGKVVAKKQLLETCLFCLNRLDNIEEVCNPNKSSLGSGHDSHEPHDMHHSERHRGTRNRRDLLRTIASSQRTGAQAAHSRDIFECAELERVSASIAAVIKSVQETQRNWGVGGAGVGFAESGHAAMMKSIEQRSNNVLGLLLSRIQGRMVSILSTTHAQGGDAAYLVPSSSGSITHLGADISHQASPGRSDASQGDDTAKDGFPVRSWRHLIRALELLNREQLLGEVFAEAVTLPAAKIQLMQGRVDGTGGRGSFSGLQECLSALIDNLRYSVEACKCLSLCSGSPRQHAESARATRTVVLHGIWVPVAKILVEKYSGMFSSGIAATMARCYQSIDSFIKQLGCMVGESWSAMASNIHESITEFHSRWKLELYLQLRVQEISSRIERHCEISRVYGVCSTTANTYCDSLLAGTSSVTVAGSVLPALPASVSETQIQQMWNKLQLAGFKLPIIRAVALEAGTCLHEAVLLRALSPKMLALILRLLIRFEALVSAITDSSTPSFPKGAVIPDAVAPEQTHPIQVAGTAVAINTSASPSPITPMTPGSVATITPTKKPVVAGRLGDASPALPPSTSTATSTHVITGPTNIAVIDDLVAIAQDLFYLSQWLTNDFSDAVVSSMCGIDVEKGGNNNSSKLARQCLMVQGDKIEALKRIVWNRTTSLLAQDCKTGLTAVKTVASKYRMTNKPPPTAPSPYVETTLQPFRGFVAKYVTVFDKCTSNDDWKLEIIEDVTAQFVIQVQSLMETVRSMDSALQRRSKLKTAPPSTTSAAGVLTDSEKISLQLYLDVKSFEAQVQSLGVDVSLVSSWSALFSEVNDSNRLQSS